MTLTHPGRYRSPLRLLRAALNRIMPTPATQACGLSAVEVEALLTEYREARDAADAAGRRAEIARTKLDGVPAGIYGPWLLKWNAGRQVLDQPAARARLEELGEAVPMTATRQPISVKKIAPGL